MMTTIRKWLACHLALILVAVWAAWDIATAAAYIDGAPPQLQTVEALIHFPIWILWLTVAGILMVGMLTPAHKGGWWREVGTFLRGLGLALNAGLLAMWAAEFLLSDAGRGWVSAKNYALLAFMALHHGWIVSQHSMREG